MTVAGVICEYNPFHKGHEYHLSRTRREGADAVVAVMSTSFVQRGEPASFDEKVRCAAALRGGADLVIALPLPRAMSAAASFAEGGVSLLASSGVVDVLSFGSECGDVNIISSVCDALEGEEYTAALRSRITTGMSFASARQSALCDIGSDASILSSPNDTLAVEYARACRKYCPGMGLMAVKRIGGHDSSESDGFACASVVREKLSSGEFADDVPEYAFGEYASLISSGKAPASVSFIERAVLSSLRMMSATQLSCAPDVSEGIENRIADAAREASSLAELYSLAKTKRYSHARIRRIVMSAYLGITAEDVSAGLPYIRVIGFNETGRALLTDIKKKSSLPVVTGCSSVSSLGESAGRLYALECRGEDIRSLCLPVPEPCGMLQKSEIVKY